MNLQSLLRKIIFFLIFLFSSSLACPNDPLCLGCDTRISDKKCSICQYSKPNESTGLCERPKGFTPYINYFFLRLSIKFILD